MEREDERQDRSSSYEGGAQILADPELGRVLYGHLRELAVGFMAAERRNHTLQPTALANEAVLRLAELTDIRWRDRTHFFAAAAGAIRRVLIDYARRHGRQKRGNGQLVVKLHAEPATDGHIEADVIDVHEALKKLEALDPELARVVELRFFGGLTVDEVAIIMELSPRAIAKKWALAKALLASWLSGHSP